MIVHFDQTVSAIVQASATVGLASIYNSGDEYGLGTEAVSVIRDPATGHLALDVLIVVQGDYTILRGFSYNASIVASIDEPYVAGVIQWNPSVTGRLGVPLVAPTHHSGPSATPSWFELDAKRDLYSPPSDPPPPPPAPPVFPVPTSFAVLAHETRAVSITGDVMQVPYSLRLGNIPSAVGDPFYLAGTILAGTFPHTHVALRMQQISGPNPIALTGSHLYEDDINFFISPVRCARMTLDPLILTPLDGWVVDNHWIEISVSGPAARNVLVLADGIAGITGRQPAWGRYRG